MRTLFILLLALIALAAAALGVFYWQGIKGIAADILESQYVTAADRFVDVAGARVRIREEGDRNAPPIILIHGFTHSLETWDGWASALKTDYRVIRYDLLGHGLSGPDPQERYAPEERAAFVGEIMDALNIEKAVIAGNSLGGLAAWRFASNQHDRVEALVLVSPGAFPLYDAADEPAEIPPAMRLYLLTAPLDGVRKSAEFIYGDDAKLSDERVAEMHAMIRREGNGAAMIKSLEEFTLPDPSDELASIETPTLLLWGDKDIIIPIEQGRKIEAVMPDARLIAYPGVGHAAQEEAPSRTVEDVIAFLGERKSTTAQIEQ